MAQSYYVIELSKRWLTMLLVGLAVVMVLAFALGYGAAWSVLSGSRPAQQAQLATPTPTPETVDFAPTETASSATVAAPPEPSIVVTATPPPPTPKPQPTKTPTPASAGFHVQVLASARQRSIEEAQQKVEDLGFSRDHQQVSSSQVAGGGVLYKLRIGPFPDRASADRVVVRMRASGFPDAWVVAP